HLVRFERDTRRIVADTCALILRQVGRYVIDVAADFRRRPLIECREAQDRRLAEVQLIDVLRRNLDFHGQRICIRNDQHDRLARRDDTADRVNGELMNDAVLRRPDIDALQLVLGGDLPLGQLGNLGPDIGEILADLGSQILVNLNDLKLELGNLAFGLGSNARQLASLPLKPSGVALERIQPGERNEILLVETAYAFKLLVNEIDLALLRGGLSEVALNFVPQLRDSLPKLCFLTVARLLPQIEQAALRGGSASSIRVLIAGALQQIGR